MDWTHGAAHMWDNHGVTVDQASEAIADVDALLYDPDPKSKSGGSARLMGYSASRRHVLVVILVRREDRPGAWWGANGWGANAADADTYRKENGR
ncbi:MAG: hypothetical protein Q8P38_11900 [Candidatus Nanopelagicales bacterium]|nr:hypothetical protein [Candidatus Nanopelagicales bacterium]